MIKFVLKVVDLSKCCRCGGEPSKSADPEDPISNTSCRIEGPPGVFWELKAGLCNDCAASLQLLADEGWERIDAD